MNDFDALLSELGTLSKAMQPEGEDKVRAAAKEAGAAMPEGAEGEGEGEGNKEGEADDEMFGKSFQVTLADGSVQEAFDGTSMMKAMAAQVTELRGQQAAAVGDLAKALQVASGLTAVVKQQGDLLKSLRAELAAVGDTGRGRAAAVTLIDKPGAGGPAAPAAPAAGDIMAKAMTAFQAGTLAGSDVARLEAHFGRGLPAPADIVARLPA